MVTRDLALREKQLVWESQKLREAESGLHRKEQELAKWQEKVSVVRLQLQGFQEKLEQGVCGGQGEEGLVCVCRGRRGFVCG